MHRVTSIKADAKIAAVNKSMMSSSRATPINWEITMAPSANNAYFAFSYLLLNIKYLNCIQRFIINT